MAYDRPPTRRPRDPLADDIVDALEERLREQRRKNALVAIPVFALLILALVFSIIFASPVSDYFTL